MSDVSKRVLIKTRFEKRGTIMPVENYENYRIYIFIIEFLNCIIIIRQMLSKKIVKLRNCAYKLLVFFS